MANGNETRLVDGQIDFSGGVSADNNKTIASPLMPQGVPRNCLSWLINGTVRGGAISPRNGWEPLVQTHLWSPSQYGGGLMYQPDTGDPFLLILINGNLYKIRVDTDNSVTNLSAQFGFTLPVTDHAYLTQAEMFAVIQAGNETTNPLFYDFGVPGVATRPETLRSSQGFLGVGNASNEIPPSGPMDYWANRLWYALGRRYCAGDIAGNTTSGTLPYQYRDAVLHVTENPIAKGGDGFIVPTMAGNIRALGHTSHIDTTLGTSPLYIFTRQSVYTCEAPVTRADWVATDNNKLPLQKLALGAGGSYGDRSLVQVNSDLFFQSPPNGDVRSIAVSTRNDREWGNVPLSRNVNRALVFNDRAMLRASTGIAFDNRLLQSTLPIQTPVGIGHRGIIALNFDLISTLEERRPPAWEGVGIDTDNIGLHVLQYFKGDFGGRERAFAVAWSLEREQIEIWELTNDTRFDGGLDQRRITLSAETPAYNVGQPFTLKELVGGELWLDKVLGTVVIEVYYKPDSYGCWIPWKSFEICAAKDCREDPLLLCSDTGYPIDPFCEQDRVPIALPKPPPQCISATQPLSPFAVGRPSTWCMQAQVKIVGTGWFRIRGILVHFDRRTEPAYTGLVRGNPLPERLGGVA